MLAKLLRALYIVVAWLLAPIVILHLLWRSLGNSDYRRRIGERFGFFPKQALHDTIWLHVVSVGEAQAAERLVRVLLEPQLQPVELLHVQFLAVPLLLVLRLENPSNQC